MVRWPAQTLRRRSNALICLPGAAISNPSGRDAASSSGRQVLSISGNGGHRGLGMEESSMFCARRDRRLAVVAFIAVGVFAGLGAPALSASAPPSNPGTQRLVVFLRDGVDNATADAIAAN